MSLHVLGSFLKASQHEFNQLDEAEPVGQMTDFRSNDHHTPICLLLHLYKAAAHWEREMIRDC